MKIKRLKSYIRKLEDDVNCGGYNHDYLWRTYCGARKELAVKLLNEEATVTERGLYRLELDIPTLRLLYKCDFPEGTVIAVRKYRIWCKGRCTTASRFPKLDDLTEGQMPQYIHRFIF